MRLWKTCVLILAVVAPARADSLVLVAGGGEGGDGVPATRAKLDSPFGVDFDRDGRLVFVEYSGHRVRAIDPDGVVRTLAGTGRKGDGGDGGPAAKAEFNGMHTLAILPDGRILVADTFNNRVRQIDPKTGVIEPFAGTGEKGFSGDNGPARSASFGGVYCVALDPEAHHVDLTDLDNRRIRRVDLAKGTVVTIAGNGKRGVPTDGAPAIESPLVDPRASTIDAKGNVYVLERGGHALRVVDPKGLIRTVAGTGRAGSGGIGGDARLAAMNGPKHLCVDRNGDVLIADTENHRIVKYRPGDGALVLVAGTGTKGAGGLGGPPEEAQLSQPHGVAVDREGTIYIADSSNHRVVKINRD